MIPVEPGLLALLALLAPVARPLPPDLGEIAAPLVALRLVDRLPAPCPPDMVLVDGDFCPSLPYACQRYVETHGEEPLRCAEYARVSRCFLPLEPRRYCIDAHEWPDRTGERPRVYVSWHDAQGLCASRGRRLCRRSEWVLACEGPKRLPYPWGFARHPTPCNIDRGYVPYDIDALENPETREAELERLWQGDPSGSHPQCTSAFGAFDMSGNVDEWTDNRADNPGTYRPATLNGGYWGPVRDTCRLATIKHGPTFRFYQVGLRCCADATDGIEAPVARPLRWYDDPDSKAEW